MGMYEQDKEQSKGTALERYTELMKQARDAYSKGDRELAYRLCLDADEQIEKSGILEGF